MIKKSKVAFLILLILYSIALTSCTTFTTELYAEEKNGTMVDKNVELKYFSKKNKSELMLEFEEKEIPFEIEVIAGSDSYESVIEMSGELESGEIIITFFGYGKELWEKKYGVGLFEDVEGTELYEGKYNIRITFLQAQNGKLKLHFKTKGMWRVF